MIFVKILLAVTIFLNISYSYELSDFIDLNKCDQIINKNTYKICYSYKDKSLLSGWTTLTGKLVQYKNIKKRPSFYAEKSLPFKYRTSTRDYARTGFDRGHTIISDADADYSKSSLYEAYSLANITFQYPRVNRIIWLKIERYGRKEAKIHKSIISITKVKYSKRKVNKISIPAVYYRIYYNNIDNFSKCFRVQNTKYIKTSNIENYVIDCKKLVIKNIIRNKKFKRRNYEKIN